jgi:formylglycine-generating enzyme required for sulfatase activity
MTARGMVALVALTLIGFVCLIIAASNMKGLMAGQTFRDCMDCPEMVVIPAGNFQMGSPEEETEREIKSSLPPAEIVFARKWAESERPQHSVKIERAFALSKYRVTRGEFAAFVQETGYSTAGGCTVWIDHTYPLVPEADWQSPGFSQTDRDPVVCVNWFDAKAYVAWLNTKVRDHASLGFDDLYGLPSEAQWEYAARAGTKTARWWGDSVGLSNTDCGGCGSQWDKKQPAPSGSFRTNSFGLSDILGNAWEWTEDCWNLTHAGALENEQARNTGNCGQRVRRGGDWSSDPWVVRSAHRTGGTAIFRTNYVGFRVAKTSP